LAQLNINTDGCVVLTDRLERLNRSALPVAVRQTLNAAAFDVKKVTLPKSAENNFIKRSPNFFKIFSKVNKATGFNMRSMKAEVGMTDNGKQSARTAVKNMDVQEGGGSIDSGSDYLKASRGGNNKKKVTRSNYFDKSRIVKGPFKKATTTKSQFVASAFVAMRENKRMSISTSKGRFLMQVKKVWKYKRRSAVKVSSKLLMKSRSQVNIRATNFSKEAAKMTSDKIEGFFAVEAQKQFDRVFR